jgi:hypothetical protein
VVTQLINATNVTFECSLAEDSDTQILSQWNIVDFEGDSGARNALSVPGTTLEGDPAPPENIFDTFRNRLVFASFLEDLDGATLLCGVPPSATDLVQFPLRVYRKCMHVCEVQGQTRLPFCIQFSSVDSL